MSLLFVWWGKSVWCSVDDWRSFRLLYYVLRTHIHKHPVNQLQYDMCISVFITLLIYQRVKMVSEMNLWTKVCSIHSLEHIVLWVNNSWPMWAVQANSSSISSHPMPTGQPLTVAKLAALSHNDSRQVVHPHVPMSPSSIKWYQLNNSECLLLVM